MRVHGAPLAQDAQPALAGEVLGLLPHAGQVAPPRLAVVARRAEGLMRRPRGLADADGFGRAAFGHESQDDVRDGVALARVRAFPLRGFADWTPARRVRMIAAMFGTFDTLFAAVVVFVGGHFLLSSQPVRDPLVTWLGAQRFTSLYSLAAAAALVWLAMAYSNAAYVPIWTPPPDLHWATAALTLVACLLVATGATTPSPTTVGSERRALSPADPAPGIFRVTRHPVMWGVALWSVGHLLANGDGASMMLFGGLLVLALGGMAHIDQKRARVLGAAWGPIQLTTSAIPFRALVTGRTSMDWSGIGMWRPLAGLALYLALTAAHPWFAGVTAVPA